MFERKRHRRAFHLPPNAKRVTGDVDAELQFHLEMRTAELVARGLNEDAARAEALRQFGDVAEASAYCRAMDKEGTAERRRGDWWGDLRRDLQLAGRSLAARPAFSAAIVVMLALGIGANVTMFGIIDRLLLRPPAHVAEPDLVRRVFFKGIEDGEAYHEASASWPQYLDLSRHLRSASASAAFWNLELVFGEGTSSRRANVTLATASFLPLLGVRPVLGRLFTAQEDAVPRGSDVAVISHALWQAQFGGRDDVLDRELAMSGRRLRIVGVLPAGFSDVGTERVDAWVPVSAMAGELLDGRYSDKPWYEARNLGWLHTIVRLRSDDGRGAAEREATDAYRASLVERWGTARADSTRPAVTLESLLLERGPDRSPTSRIALWLGGMSLVVLLIACANVANLLLARALARRREIAMRVALGAGRGRLVRQLLVEGVVLAALGGLGAILVAHWGGGFLRAALVPQVAWSQNAGDARLLLLTATIALVTGVLTGLVPALQASAPNLVAALKSGAREGGGERALTRRVLVVAQAALSVVLLVGAGLFLRSLHNVRSMPLGYAPDQVLTVNVDLTGSGYSPQQELTLHDRLLERVRNVPGVRSAALAITTPFSTTIDQDISLPGLDSIAMPPSGPPLVNAVTPAYFETMQTPIVRGRGFTDEDQFGSRPVAVVSELMARTLWPGRDAIGECVVLVDQPGKPCVEVVGVAKGVVWQDFRERERMQLYVAMAQKVYDFTLRSLYVRAQGEPMSMAKSLRDAVLEIEPRARLVQVRLLAENQQRELRPWRLGASLFTVFGALALLLAALGLYSVIAYNVTRRMHEMGVRVALGARGADILRLVVGEGVRVAAVGIAIGSVAALIGARWLAELLFQTSPQDPYIFGGVALVLLAVALAASLIPALRATRVAPGSALRSE